MKSILYLTTFFLVVNLQILQGQTPNWIWAKSPEGGIKQFAEDVATDRSGNVYLTGFFTSQYLVFDSDTLHHLNPLNIYVAKFNSNGNLIWARTMYTTGGNVSSILVDTAG